MTNVGDETESLLLLQDASRLVEEAEQKGFRDRNDFDKLADNLLEVAQILANINTRRIQETSCSRGTTRQQEPIPVWRTKDKAQVKQIIDVGINLAELMLDLVGVRNEREEVMVEHHDFFVSFAGEELSGYVSPLTARPPFRDDFRLFVADESMEPGRIGDPPKEMLQQVLLSTVVVCVVSVEYLQRKWPICELLCALARNRRACSRGRPPAVIIDAMPGISWVANRSQCSQRSPAEWVNDIKSLLPIVLPSMQGYAEKRVDEHMEKLERSAVKSWEMVSEHRKGIIYCREGNGLWVRATIVLAAIIALVLLNCLVPSTAWAPPQKQTPSSTGKAPTIRPSQRPTNLQPSSSMPSVYPTMYPSFPPSPAAPVGPCTIETGIGLRNDYDERVYGCEWGSCKKKIRDHWLDYLNTLDVKATITVVVRGLMDRATGYDGPEDTIGRGEITDVVKDNEQEGAQITYRDHQWFVHLAENEDLEVTACFEGNRPCPWCARNHDGRCTGYVTGSVTVTSPTVAHCPDKGKQALHVVGRTV